MKKDISVFSSDEINTGRQPELDLLKTVTIFFMIFGHVSEVVFSKTWEDMEFCDMTIPWQILYVLMNCVFAFGFMFSMGASIPFSRHQSAKIWIMRGFKLILAWFVLRLFYVYPLSLIFAQEHGMTIMEFCLCVICSSDILFFAGTFFLFIGILRKMKASLTATILTAVGLFIIGHFVSYNPSSDLMQYILGNFIITDKTFFPFINWIMAPVLGICWGKMLRHCADKDRLYFITGIFGLIGSGVILLVSYMNGIFSGDGLQKLCDVQVFYDANIVTVTVACCFLAVLLSLYYAIVRIVRFHWFKAIYSYLSMQLTNIYFIQWVIIPWLALCLPRPTQKMSPWWGILIAIFVFGVSAGLAGVYTGIKTRYKHRIK